MSPIGSQDAYSFCGRDNGSLKGRSAEAVLICAAKHSSKAKRALRKPPQVTGGAHIDEETILVGRSLARSLKSITWYYISQTNLKLKECFAFCCLLYRVSSLLVERSSKSMEDVVVFGVDWSDEGPPSLS